MLSYFGKILYQVHGIRVFLKYAITLILYNRYGNIGYLLATPRFLQHSRAQQRSRGIVIITSYNK